MDIFKEFIVKKELNTGEKTSRLFIIVASVALGVTFIMFTLGTILQLFGFLFAGLSVYIGWQLIIRFFVEYEYIVTNADLDIDKIINQSSRKRLCTVDLHKVSEYGRISGDFSADGDETVIRATAQNPELEDYYLRFEHKNYGKCLLLFTPSVEILDLLKHSFPRNAVNRL